jgi:hypothetical protein
MAQGRVQRQQERQDEPGQTRNPPGTPVASRRPPAATIPARWPKSILILSVFVRKVAI